MLLLSLRAELGRRRAVVLGLWCCREKRRRECWLCCEQDEGVVDCMGLLLFITPQWCNAQRFVCLTETKLSSKDKSVGEHVGVLGNKRRNTTCLVLSAVRE
ncbi:hypothetical protein L1987_48542 [Smallanthus sonchifolius]|uniref:Uncharacterized protein n=1 Tax=Smallanthus sonchifolius TaxID=185202 RepID=A0ACB9FS96_9ASTR|nr:hypothetical protein L1987_48542 [Smallanthus sonchifolius]